MLNKTTQDQRPAVAVSRWSATVGFIVSIAICLGIGALGAGLTSPEIPGWYRSINKPSWNPPDSIFGPVWTMLYVMMGISAWDIWLHAGFRRSVGPLVLFAFQLFLNLAWSWIFFRQHAIGFALIEIVALWLAIVATMVAFFRRSILAGGLLVPYLAWVSFATVLNHAIWQLNK